MGEEWRDVVGWPGYQVSSEGRVRSVDRIDALGRRRCGRVLKQYPCQSAAQRARWAGKGHLAVTLCRDGRRRIVTVHTLVAEAFLGPCPKGHECRHLNGECTDNRVNNITWGTALENHLDSLEHGTHARGEAHGRAKLTAEQVAFVHELARAGESQVATGRRVGVSQQQVSYILAGENWRHLHPDPRVRTCSTLLRRLWTRGLTGEQRAALEAEDRLALEDAAADALDALEEQVAEATRATVRAAARCA